MRQAWGAVEAAGDAHPRHRGDGGQGLAAEAHGAHVLQVVEAGDLAGGVALQGQRQLVLGDAAAVVGHPDAPHAALLELHLDGRRAGVHGVFEHFLEHRGGRSTTSPAAIWLMRWSGGRWMGMAASWSAGADCSRWKQKRPARHAAAGRVGNGAPWAIRTTAGRAPRRRGLLRLVQVL
jgi:hypothetical protein